MRKGRPFGVQSTVMGCAALFYPAVLPGGKLGLQQGEDDFQLAGSGVPGQESGNGMERRLHALREYGTMFISPLGGYKEG